MKKKILLSLILVISILFMASCSNNSDNKNNEPEVIELSTRNIEDYIGFQGDFVDGSYRNVAGITNVATSTLEIETYPLEDGRFEDVEVTVVCTSTAHGFTYMNNLGNYWHLSTESSDVHEIRITLPIRPNGEFERSYQVECLNNTSSLVAPCDFRIVEVSGTFIPED